MAPCPSSVIHYGEGEDWAKVGFTSPLFYTLSTCGEKAVEIVDLCQIGLLLTQAKLLAHSILVEREGWRRATKIVVPLVQSAEYNFGRVIF